MDFPEERELYCSSAQSTYERKYRTLEVLDKLDIRVYGNEFLKDDMHLFQKKFIEECQPLVEGYTKETEGRNWISSFSVDGTNHDAFYFCENAFYLFYDSEPEI